MAQHLSKHDIRKLFLDENYSEPETLSDFQPYDEDNISDNENMLRVSASSSDFII